MIDKIKELKTKKERQKISIFTESILKTSFYDELQKNGWCDIVDDGPDDLSDWYKMTIKKNKK